MQITKSSQNHKRLYRGKMSILEILITNLQNNSFDSVYDYLNNIPTDEEHKNELITAIEMFPLEPLYDTLLSEFAGTLSKDEHMYYKQEYINEFSSFLPTVCEELDELYEIYID